MSDKSPAYQVPAVEYGKPGVIGKAGICQIIIFPNPANAGIWVKTSKNWIFIGALRIDLWRASA
jgi:hypothetical protein